MTSRTPRDQDPDRDGPDNVVGIDTMVDLDLDATEPSEKYPPFRLKLGGQVFEVEQPDAGLVMEIGSAGSVQTTMALIFDEQWPDVRPLLAGRDPEDLIRISRNYTMHFDLDEVGVAAAAAPTRQERRRARRTRRR